MAQAEAEAMAALGIEEKGAVVVTAAEGWHPGVVGLVAARLKEKFGRPAFAIALEPGGIGTGSGRSIAGVDIGRAVRRAVAEGLLVKGGGHAMAAGVTLRKGALAQLRAFLEAALSADVETARRASGLMIDGAVSAAGANLELVAMIERAGPFGSGNPEPVIALPAHTVTYAEEVGQAHMRVRLRSADGAAVNAIAFRAAGQKLGTALLQQPRPAGPCRRLLRDRPLAGRGARAVPAHRYRAGGAFCRAVGGVLRACRQGVPAMSSLTRRSALMLGAGMTLTLVAADDGMATPAEADAEIAKFTAAKAAESGKITIDLPEIAENGNTVPLAIKVDSPMTADDYVSEIRVIGDANPNPGIVRFHLTPMSGRAEAATRIRLGGTGTVTVLAKTSTGKLYAERKVVKVTVGGCGG